MLKKSAKYFENIAEEVGVSIKIPCPNKKTKRTLALVNGTVGIGLMASGIVFKKLTLTTLGILGIAGAILLAVDE